MKKLFALAAASLAGFALAASAAADETDNYVIRLGRDTTAVERVIRTPSRIEVDQVGRSPRVLRRHYTYELAKGAFSRVDVTATVPGATSPLQTVETTVGDDSVRVQVRGQAGAVQHLAAPTQPGVRVVYGTSPWIAYESAVMELGRRDSLRVPIYFVGTTSLNWLTVQRIGRDSVAILTDREDVFHARVGPGGRLVGVLPIAGTGKFSVERVAKLDLEALTASFGAREKEGAGLGVLSPRDTVRVANAGGATLWVDYGRPGKRGREIFGDVVPFGAVWRTGANAATQFKTDKALDFGGVVVPAGFYTLWTIPNRDGWKLVVNGETGQWGTEHKADKDLYTIDMKVSSLAQPAERFTISVEPSATGGVLNLDWDTTRASTTFTVKP